MLAWFWQLEFNYFSGKKHHKHLGSAQGLLLWQVNENECKKRNQGVVPQACHYHTSLLDNLSWLSPLFLDPLIWDKAISWRGQKTFGKLGKDALSGGRFLFHASDFHDKDFPPKPLALGATPPLKWINWAGEGTGQVRLALPPTSPWEPACLQTVEALLICNPGSFQDWR